MSDVLSLFRQALYHYKSVDPLPSSHANIRCEKPSHFWLLQEMLALSSFMTGAPMSDVTSLFREAFYRYNSVDPLRPKACVRLATRSMLLLADYCKQHGLHSEAHSALMKAQSQVRYLPCIFCCDFSGSHSCTLPCTLLLADCCKQHDLHSEAHSALMKAQSQLGCLSSQLAVASSLTHNSCCEPSLSYAAAGGLLQAALAALRSTLCSYESLKSDVFQIVFAVVPFLVCLLYVTQCGLLLGDFFRQRSLHLEAHAALVRAQSQVRHLTCPAWLSMSACGSYL